MTPILSEKFLVCVFLVALSWCCVAWGADTAYRIVRPNDEAHELLPKTCRVCHKDGDLKFLIVAAPDDASLDAAVARLAGGAEVGARSPARPTNPHAEIACLFCHLEPPGEGADPGGMAFRTLEGTEASLEEVERSCRLCHPSGAGHRKVLGAGDPGPDLARAGLPLADGRAVCTTCHDMHTPDPGPADVRRTYLRFAARSPVSYVHGNRAGCRACHPTELAPGSVPVFSDPDDVARCRRCHTDGHDKVHPVGVTSSRRTYPMDFLEYPLDKERRLICSTCHDEVCTEKPDPRRPRFLRGGPYSTATEFCYRCHPRAGLGALSPHDQVDDDGNVVRTSCVFCHRVVPMDPEGKDFRPEDLSYLHSPVELCLGCHAPGPHPTVNHLVEVPEKVATKLHAYEERHRVKFPLDARGRIVCTTCHNPHEKGVLRGGAALGASELGSWRVPSFAELCTPCHARYD